MKKYGVIVCGGGPAGIAAALAAARAGVKTAIIERYGFLGGLSTAALVYPWMSFHAGNGEQVIAGVAQEIVSLLIERGWSPGHLRDTIGSAYSVTPFNIEGFKVLADELLTSAGIDIYLHSQVISAETDNGSITKICLIGKGGARYFSARIFVDATGDGDLAMYAGAPNSMGRRTDNQTQPMTLNFMMGDVDIEAIKTYIRQNPEDFHPGSLIDDLDKIQLTGVSGFFSQWRQYGPSEIPRDRVLFFTGILPGTVNINTTRILGRKGTSLDDLTAAEIEGRHQVQLLVKFFCNHIPGFQNAKLLMTATQVGVRETRHITGEYILNAEDLINARRFDDVIARGGFPLDIHDPSGSTLVMELIREGCGYDIPYRCLLPLKVTNLYISGRCVSVTHTAFSSVRVTPCCMATGEAAGVAAALCVLKNTLPRTLDIHILQEYLKAHNVILD